MRTINNGFVQLLGLSLLLLLPYGQGDAAELNLRLPPDSIAQWYKPQNKRHVWLHTMFKLRRSMQALEEYAELNEASHMKKWADSFDSNYRKLGEMVPEWNDELELEWSTRLKGAAEAGDVASVRRALRKVKTSCRSCHNEYQLVSAVLYRSPDFTALKIPHDAGEPIGYREFMTRMSRRVNQVKIFYEDGDHDMALDAAVDLQRLMKLSSASCSECHKEEASTDRIFARNADYNSALQAGISAGNTKQVNEQLGNIGAFVCARCHAVHKPVAELRELLKKKQQH